HLVARQLPELLADVAGEYRLQVLWITDEVCGGEDAEGRHLLGEIRRGHQRHFEIAALNGDDLCPLFIERAAEIGLELEFLAELLGEDVYQRLRTWRVGGGGIGEPQLGLIS